MRRFVSVLGAGLLGLALLGGCKSSKKAVQKTAPKSETKAVRMDTVLQRPKNFESIHQMELKEHESAAVSRDTARPPKP